MKKSFQLALVALATIASSSAFAGTYNQASPFKHFYVGGGAGYGQFNKSSPANIIKKRDGLTLNGVAGYRFNKYLAAQAEYFYLPIYKLDQTASNAKTYSNVAALEVKGILPLGNQFNLFAKAGYTVAFQKTRIDSGSTDKEVVYEPIAGAGAEFMVTPQIGVNVQYTGIYTTNKDKFDTVNMGTAGLNLYF